MGGDEFVALLNDTAEDRAAAVAERIQTAFQTQAARIDDCPVKATVSTGMVFSANGSYELPALLVRADQALYRAKADGRNRLALASADSAVSADDEARAARRRLLEHRDAAA